MSSSIGVKIANGEFYPLIEENSLTKKKMVLTTAHDNQPSIQVDLYRSPANAMAYAQYIGSLVVENIQPKPKGEPNIEMTISSNNNGDIIADAIDLDSGSDGEHYVLTVSLKSLDETSHDMEIPDFELDSNEEPPIGLYQHAKKTKQKKQGKSLAWLFILIGLIIILGLIAAWLFFLGGMDFVNSKVNLPFLSQVSQPAAVSQPEPVRQSEPVKQLDPLPAPVSETVQQIAEPAPVIQAPAQPPAPRPQTASNRPLPPVASYNVPAVIPREGVDYRIRYGDTLWDISEAFYRDPWLYSRIARYNNIRNPNYIISGRIIKIPPKS